MMDSAQFRRAGYEAIDKIAQYYETVHQKAVQPDVKPGFLRDLVPKSPPDDGEPWAHISRDISSVVEPGLCHWTHPGFMAYFPASSTFEGILGELYSAAFNAPCFDWVCSPIASELESAMTAWVADLLALPAAFQPTPRVPTKGAIQGSTTECIISTMVTARDRYVRNAAIKRNDQGLAEQESTLEKLVVLGSSETHASTEKAAAIIGVQYRYIDCSPTDGVAMTETKLVELINQCEAEGLVPFYLTATLGTTNSCAVDDFTGIFRALSNYPHIWVHVDAAFAGAALVCEEYHGLASDMAHVDSLSVNLGKWLLTNLDCTMLFVSQPAILNQSLHNSFEIVMPIADSSQDIVNYRDWQLSMTRRFRALKVWFVLRSWGTNRIKQHIRRHLEMAAQLTTWFETKQNIFEIVCRPQFAMNVIRVREGWAVRAGWTADAATIAILERVNNSRKYWLSKALIDGRVVIRIIAANMKSDTEALQRLFELLVETAVAL